MKRLIGNERGQTLAIMAVSITALIAMTAFVLDVGSWFRVHRATQAAADASALAGAQALPGNTSQASSLALQYSSQNGGGVGSGDIQFSSYSNVNDTITVEAKRTSPGFFANIFGISTIDVKAKAAARAFNLGSAQFSAPFGVDISHPLISGAGCPNVCFNQQTTLELNKIGPGAFKVLNVDGSQGGTGQSTLAQWIRQGYDGLMPLGWYFSDPGAKFNPSEIQDALDQRIGDELLFPVYDLTQAQGSNFEYRVVGWIGFHLTDYEARGNNSILEGYFTKVIWEGVEGSPGSVGFGAYTVKLVE